MMVSAAPLLSLLVCTLAAATGPATSWGVEGFLAPSFSRPALFRGGAAMATSSLEGVGEVVAAAVPTWEDLESNLEKIRSNGRHGAEKTPVLTLYRDTNGWCPFCERVWVAVRAKGLPYQETLVPLQGKPEWYKQMVPTGLVPAVLFHGEEVEDDEISSSSRELVWESDAILQALDDKFPDTIQLMNKSGDKDKDEAYEVALKLQNRLQAAGFTFAYGNRNGTLTDSELEQHRSEFESILDELDVALGNQEGGSFRLGADFSGMDAIVVPTLERWRYQLPLTEGLDILEGRSHLRDWFDRMDSYPAYGDRVAGDEYSWTATASMFLRYFGGGEDKPKVASGIAKADAAAEELANGFAQALGSAATHNRGPAALEAATKLVSNREAVLSDCMGAVEVKSQGHISRAETSARDTVDALLRHVANRLLRLAASEEEDDSEQPPVYEVRDLANNESSGTPGEAAVQGALALRTVAKRLCVPRDMGAPSAALLRGILATVADDLSPIVGSE